MRYYEIPADVLLVNKFDGKPLEGADGAQKRVSFKDFFLNVLYDSQWGKTRKRLRMMKDLEQRFDDVAWKPGRHVAVSDEEHETIVEVMENPSLPYNPSVLSQCDAHFNAIEKASTKNPDKPPPEPELDEKQPAVEGEQVPARRRRAAS